MSALGPHEKGVRMHKGRAPYWNRQTFKTEVIGEEASYQEAELQRQLRLENMPVTDVNHQVRLPLAGGPLDGGTFRVPTMMLRRAKANLEFPIPIPEQQASKLILPEGVHRPLLRAVYRLDRSAPPTLRFVRVQRI